ncbi:hypothetical protein DFH06DRAFT_452850 [Mycena polygramma]|nr:hypothetical protein DFH06DRAFT_452850 [Mycena polygramma]
MVEAMSRVAKEPSDERSDRDQRALVWTMKSLSDDRELEPFVEAVPDLLWGPHGKRHTFDDQILGLLKTPDVLLHHRIGALLKSCSSGILSSDASKRRRIACYRALWAVAHLSSTRSSQHSNVAVDFSYICEGATDDDFQSDDPHGLSVWALMQWSTFGAVQQQLLGLRKHLEQCLLELHPSLDELTRQSTFLDLDQINSTINGIKAKFREAPHTRDATRRLPCRNLTPAPSLISTTEIQKCISDINHLLSVQPCSIVLEYLAQSALLSSTPYHWDETRKSMPLETSVPISGIRHVVREQLFLVLHPSLLRLNKAQNISEAAWIDTSIATLLSFWNPEDTTIQSEDEQGLEISVYSVRIIRFINGLESETALEYVLRNGGRCELYLWSTLSTAVNLPWSSGVTQEELHEFLTAMWRVARLRIHEPGRWDDPDESRDWDESRLTRLASVVEALLKHEFPSLKALILGEIFTDFAHKMKSGMLNGCSPSDWLVYHRLFLRVQVEIPDTKPADMKWDLNGTWVSAARISIVAEFLDQCASGTMPYEAIKTLEALNTQEIIPKAAIDAAHQTRLANAVDRCFVTGNCPDLLATIVDLRFWSHYRPHKLDFDWLFEELDSIPWLDDATARNDVKDCFTVYEAELASATEESPTLSRLREILEGLSTKHPEPKNRVRRATSPVPPQTVDRGP